MGLTNIFVGFLKFKRNYNFVNNPTRQNDKSNTREMNSNLPSTDLNFEMNRLKTFKNWTSCVDKNILASLGFYYYGPHDIVKCYFCDIELGMWRKNDNVLSDHVKWSPSCNFIRGNLTNNVAINVTLLNQILPSPPTTDVYGVMESLTNTPNEGLLERISSDRIDIKRPKFQEYAAEAKRLESYADWSKTIKQRPQILSDAGFFYAGLDDKVCCFNCGGGLKDWGENDEPWEQHAFWFGNCEYLKSKKGLEFIRQMEKMREVIYKDKKSKNGHESTNLQAPHISELANSYSNLKIKGNQRTLELSDQNKKKEFNRCKICFIDRSDMIFLPCAHVIACEKCASSMTKCPICRQSFSEVKKIYIS